MNEKANVVTQSVDGTITGSETVTVDGQPPVTQPLNAKVSEKLDFENFNARVDGSSTTKIAGEDHDIQFTAIVHAGKKTVAASYTIDGKQNCTIKPLPPQVPDPQTLAMYWKSFALPLIQSNAKCAGNDGTLDHWTIDYSGPVPKVPGQPQATGDFTVHVELKTDKDYVIHGVQENEDVKVTAPSKVETKTTASIVYDKTSPTGPSDGDLDWSQWQNCTQVQGAEVLDSTQLLQFGGSEGAKVLDKVLTKRFGFKQMIAAIAEASKSKDKKDSSVVV